MVGHASDGPEETELSDDITYEQSNQVIPTRVTALSEHLLDLIEQRVAEKAILDGLSSREVRSLYWIPLADLILEAIQRDAGMSVFFYGYLHDRLARQDSYVRMNVHMEVLRRAVTIGNKAIRYDELVPYAYLYDPYIGRQFIPRREQFRRLLLDLDMDSSLADDAVIVDRDRMSIPHLFPSIGAMSISSQTAHRSATELNELVIEVLERTPAPPDETVEAAPPKPDAALYQDLLRRASKKATAIGVRVLIVNLSYNLDHLESLIRYRREVIQEATAMARETLTKEMVTELNPFVMPPSEPEPTGMIEVEVDLSKAPLAGASMTDPYITLGQAGPLGIALDYATPSEKLRCDLPRYLLLDARLGSDIEIPVKALPKSPENIGIVELNQYLAFLRHRRPDRFVAQLPEFKPRGPLPSRDRGATDREVGYAFLDGLRSNCTSDGMICAVMVSAYKYRLDEALLEDEAMDIVPYSDGSTSDKVLTEASMKIRSIR